MTTSFDKNLFVQNGQLYIYPTLTSEEIGNDAIFNDGSYKLDVRTPIASATPLPLVVTKLHMTPLPGLYELDVIRMFHQFGF
jgi:hypothetical protein